MLEGLRVAQSSWIGRIFIAILMSFIVFSFAIWGIGDIFRNFGASTVAKVGGAEISSEALRFAYQTELQQLQRRNNNRPVTNEQARAAGVPTQVLSRLVTDAVLDGQAKSLGLSMSDDEMAKAIKLDPSFRGASGAFDRDRFNEALRDAGYSERTFVQEQRKIYLRQEIVEAVSGGISAPQTVLDGLYRYGAETRTIDYVVLPASALGEIAAPGDDVLTPWFNDRKTGYRAPEYRKLAILAVTPATVAKPDAVSDADATARYDAVKGARYGAAQKRKLQQIVFVKGEEAAEASARIKAGTATFEAIAEERKVAPGDLDIGTRAKGEMFDPKTAEAAFALPEGGVSEPIVGSFGTALVRVVAILPENYKPFAEVGGELKREIATERARAEVQVLFNKIEDQRTAGKPLPEAAKAAGLDVRVIDAIDAGGRDKAGVEVAGIPDAPAVLKAAFASDIGVDNEVVQTRDRGDVWFEVQSIEPSRERTLAEMRAEVEANWKADEISKRLAALGADLVKKLNGGETMQALAWDQKLDVKVQDNIKRNDGAGLPRNVAVQVFNAGLNQAGSAVGEADTRIVFRVTASAVPPLDPASDAGKRLQGVLAQALQQDMLTEYAAKLQGQAGVKINEAAVRQAIGGETN